MPGGGLFEKLGCANSPVAFQLANLVVMTYQGGITALGTNAHAYFELALLPEVDAREAVAALIKATNLPTTQLANVVIGFRPSLWASVAPAKHVPEKVHDFAEPIEGPDGYRMPATQVDGWLWVAAGNQSNVFDVATTILNEVSGFWRSKRQTNGFGYEHSRDLTGFEDGTENPGAYEAPGIVAVDEGQPGAGSSILLFQLWPHKVKEWNALSVSEQENVIGRSKADSVEMPDDVKPVNSHVARTVVDVDGEELDVYRRNTAYGDVARHGTVFVGFTKDQWRMNEMLRRMAGADGGPRDALTYFADVISGAWFVCPSIEAMSDIVGGFDDKDDD